VNSISFEAFVSPTVTDIEPLQLSVRLSSLVDVVTTFSPRRYIGRSFDFAASELASLDFATFGFLAAYLASALLWSSETACSTARRVSEESHSGFTPQPLRKIRKGKLQKTIDRLQKYRIKVRHASSWLNLIGQPIRRRIVPSGSQDGRLWPDETAITQSGPCHSSVDRRGSQSAMTDCGVGRGGFVWSARGQFVRCSSGQIVRWR
jgi:hypothetical protein